MVAYVDNFYLVGGTRGRLGRLKLSHLMADTRAELFAVVDRVGVSREHLQKPGEPGEHFDICKAKRQEAIDLRLVIAVDVRVMAAMRARRMFTGELGSPEGAVEWYKVYRLNQETGNG